MTPIFHTERNRPNTNAHNHSQKGNQTMTQNLFSTQEITGTALKMIASSVTLAFIAACSSQPEAPTTAEINKDNPCYFERTKEEAPDWICTGYMEGLITGIGTFPPSQASYDLRFQTAQQRGRVDIGFKMETKLKAAIKEYYSVTGTNANERIDQHIKKVSTSQLSIVLQGTRAYSSVTGPDGTLFVLMGLDEKLAAQNLKGMIKSSFGDREAAFVEDKAEKEFKKLEESVDRQFGG